MSEGRHYNILFFDCETGGLDPRQASIIEVACVLTSPAGIVLNEYTTKVVPTKPVHPRAAAVNGYSPEKWTAAVSLAEAIGCVIDYSRDALFAAHNAPFDWAFLQDAMGSVGARWRGGYHKIDTVALAMPLLMGGHVPDLKLSTLVRHFGIDPGKAHTALSDARACRWVFLKLMERYDPLFRGKES